MVRATAGESLRLLRLRVRALIMRVATQCLSSMKLRRSCQFCDRHAIVGPRIALRYMSDVGFPFFLHSHSRERPGLSNEKREYPLHRVAFVGGIYPPSLTRSPGRPIRSLSTISPTVAHDVGTGPVCALGFNSRR